MVVGSPVAGSLIIPLVEVVADKLVVEITCAASLDDVAHYSVGVERGVAYGVSRGVAAKFELASVKAYVVIEARVAVLPGM